MSNSKTTDDTVGEKRICANCVGELYLKTSIEKQGEIVSCSYCGNEGPTDTIDGLAAQVQVAFEDHFRLTPNEPTAFEYAMQKDPETTYVWFREGELVVDVIAEAAEIEQEPAEDIRSVLHERTDDWDAAQMGEEAPFDSDAQYEPAPLSDDEFQVEWANFEKSLKTEARYFSRPAEAILAATFGGINDLRARDGRPAVVEVGPGRSIDGVFRARVFQSDEKLKAALVQPEKDLGPPPFSLAGAGRMNSRGISVFYGANTPETALAEVRPPVGSQVAIGKFLLVRSLRLLDITVLHDVYVTGSVFDPNYIRKLKQAMFLEHLSRRITMPIMPDDEALEYLPTQVIADFLAAMVEPAIDGIIYPSAQAEPGHLNIALFHKASRVLPSDLPEGSKVDAYLYDYSEDGAEPDYTVMVQTPPKLPSSKSTTSNSLVWSSRLAGRQDADPREPTLRLDRASLMIHRVTAVRVVADSYSVRQHVFEASRKDAAHQDKPEEPDPFF